MTDSYNLTSLDLPKLNGRTLRLFASSLDSGALRGLLSGQLLKQGGVYHLRELRYTDPPTFYPLAVEQADMQHDMAAVGGRSLACRDSAQVR